MMRMPWKPEEPMPRWMEELPVNLDSNFITPDFQKIIDWYPEYQDRESNVLNFQTYLMEIIQKLVKVEARPGRDDVSWLSRMFEHFGHEYLVAMVRRFDTESQDGCIVVWDCHELSPV